MQHKLALGCGMGFNGELLGWVIEEQRWRKLEIYGQSK
jgi:hypothetical protein